MSLEEIYNKFKDIKYGYFNKDNQLVLHISDGFLKKFRLQSVSHIEDSKTGICWETVELLRYYLENNGLACKTYFFVIPYGKFYNHSLIVCEKDNNYYWIELSLLKLNGIRKYNNLKDLFFDLLDNFNIVTHNQKIKYKDIKIFEYSKPRDNINCLQFFYHCCSGKNITSNYIPLYLKNIAQNKN